MSSVFQSKLSRLQRSDSISLASLKQLSLFIPGSVIADVIFHVASERIVEEGIATPYPIGGGPDQLKCNSIRKSTRRKI